MIVMSWWMACGMRAGDDSVDAWVSMRCKMVMSFSVLEKGELAAASNGCVSYRG
jgi:hypothetical protein